MITTSRFYLENVNPLRDLNLARLISRIEAGERGYYSMLQWTYRWVEKTNPTVRAVKKRLMSSLGSLKWDVKIVDTGEDAEKKTLAENQAKELRAAYDEIANLRDALNFLALAELRGFSHLEKIYAREGDDPWLVKELRVVEQWYWARKGRYLPWLYNRDAKETNDGEDIDLSNYVIHAIDDPVDEIFARLSTQQGVNDADWDGFLEDYGVPPMFIVLPPNVSKDREAEYQRAAELAVSRARGSLPNGASLETPSATGSGGSGIFKERLSYLDELMVRAGTAGKLTVLAESGSGTLAGGAQKEAFDEIAQALADQISGVMQKQFDLPLLARKFPNQPVLAYFEFAAVDEEQTGKVLAEAKTAYEAGYRIDDAELSEKTGWKLSYVGNAAAGASGNGLTKKEEPAPAPAPAGPAPDSQPTPADKATSVVASNLHLTEQFVAPAKDVIDSLLAQAQKGDVTNEQLVASAEDFLKRIPELAVSTDVSEVADALEKAMRNAVEATVSGK
jgi:phage gp29-like protein